MSDFIPTANAPLDTSDPELIHRLAQHMKALGFQKKMEVPTDKPFHELDRGGEISDLAGRVAPPISPLACLTRCFLFDNPTEERALRQQLGDGFVDACFALGLLERRGDLVAGSVCILPGDANANVCDHSRTTERHEMQEFVMGPAFSTRNLIGSIPKRRFRRFLDLCSGSGAAALSAAPRTESVVAADYNQRALNLARFSAAWNGFRNVEVRFTDRFSGVDGETFDLIACNPPFAVKPSHEIMYLSGGMSGDGFSEQIIRGMPAYLAENGFAHILCDVITTTTQKSVERLTEWLTGNGCDAILFARPVMDSRDYAESWLSQLAKVDMQRYQSERTRWIQFYSDSGFVAFRHFLVVLRKRTVGEGGRPNWIQLADSPARVEESYGHHILRLFANEDLLRGGEEALLASRLKLAPDAKLEVHFAPSEREWVPEKASLRLTGGMDYEAQVPHPLALALVQLDGTVTVAQLMDNFSRLVPEEDLLEIRNAVREAITQLLRFGFLAPVEFYSTEGAA